MQKNQALREESNFADGSGPLFNMYLGMAEEEDKKMAESWKADADGSLVFMNLMFCSLSSMCQYKCHRLVYSQLLLQH